MMFHVIQGRGRGGLSLLFYLFLLTTLFAVFEISYATQQSGLYLGDFIGVSKHIQIPRTILPAIGFYFFAQLLVHIMFVFLIYIQTVLIGDLLSLSRQQTEKLGFSLWSVGIITVLLANTFFFPNSKFASLFYDTVNVKYAKG